MGCYNLTGTISQLPITHNDRIVGIFCKINSSLDYSNIIHYNGDYSLIPMCPIIYGKYDEYGGIIPDESKTTKILEDFFKTDIQTIIDSFIDISTDNMDILSPLLTQRNDNVRTIKIYPNSEPMSDLELLINHWCLVFEHESVIKTIIKDANRFLNEKDMRFRDGNYTWESLYNEQIKMFNSIGDFQFNDTYVINSLFSNGVNVHNLIFPTQYKTFIYNGLDFPNQMDLFQNYSSMYHYLFNKKLKKEYLDTLKLSYMLKVSHINMYINNDLGHQSYNLSLWKDLLKTYKKVLNNLEK